MSRPLRIAILHPELGIGGAERLIVSAALALQSRGHRPTIFTARRDPSHCFAAARDGTLDVRVHAGRVPLHVGGRLRLPAAITRMTALAPGELLTAIRIPSTWAGARFYFEKVRDRNVWDFPLLNVASATRFAAGKIDQIRIVINAAAARPLRLHAVEAAVVGKPRNEQTAELAGQIAIEGAQALRYNAYKIPLMRNLVKRAIRGNGSDT